MVQSQELTSPESFSPETKLKIGQVAARAGVSVDTVRLYERRGLLRTPDRTASGYRSYSTTAVDRILVVRQLRELGLTLDEIAAAMQAVEHGADCSSELWRLELVRDRIDARLSELTSTRRELVRAIEACQACDCQIRIPTD